MSVKTEGPIQPQDQHWMQLALDQAALAAEQGEVPVGAVLVMDDQLIASAYNCSISKCDATAHAEINAIRAACTAQQNYRLPNTCLYVTLEPCTMCLGAIVHSRIARVVFGAAEPRAGALISAAVVDFTPFNHSIAYTGAVLAEASAALLHNFFRTRRR